MKRLLPILTLALLGLSACDSGTLVSPLEPEVGEPSFAKPALPGIEATVYCPASETCSFPKTLSREPGAPARFVWEFTGEEEMEMTLVVKVSDPKITTVKAWFNGVMVLLPSATPLPGDDNQLKVTLAVLQGMNVLDVRLSAKPGEENWAEVRVEGVQEDILVSEFKVTEASFLPDPELSSECGSGFEVADWSDVEAAGDVDWTAIREDLGSEMAWIRFNGGYVAYQAWGTYGLTDFYYLITGDEHLASDYGKDRNVGPDQLWLVDASLDELADGGQQPVLCVSTSGVSTP